MDYSPFYRDALKENLDDSYDDEFEKNEGDNNSDTEEASESEFNSGSHRRSLAEPIEIKEQMYQDKLANLKRQLEELKANQHPEYLRRLKMLEFQCHERLCLNEIQRNYLTECVERDYILEKKAASKEYEEKKADLKKNLLTDFDERKKLLMEEPDGSMTAKPPIARKLRRRPNEPVPVAAEKRRKPPSAQLVLLLNEEEIELDLKMILRGKPLTPPSSNGEEDIVKFAATISAMGNEIVWVNQLNDNNKVKIHTTQLARDQVAIKRKTN